jgi:hypothetical protein
LKAVRLADCYSIFVSGTKDVFVHELRFFSSKRGSKPPFEMKAVFCAAFGDQTGSVLVNILTVPPSKPVPAIGIQARKNEFGR